MYACTMDNIHACIHAYKLAIIAASHTELGVDTSMCMFP